MIRPVAWLLALLLLAGCAGALKRPEPPIVTVADIRMGESGLMEQRFLVTLRLQNPNDFALPLRGLRYDLKLNGQDFARGVSPAAVTVPPYGEQTLQVTVTSNLLSLFRQLKSLSGGGPLRYSLAGSIGVANRHLRLPFRHSGEISL